MKSQIDSLMEVEKEMYELQNTVKDLSVLLMRNNHDGIASACGSGSRSDGFYNRKQSSAETSGKVSGTHATEMKAGNGLRVNLPDLKETDRNEAINNNDESYADNFKNVVKLPLVVEAKSSTFTLKASIKPKEFHLYIINLDVDTEATFIEQCVDEKGSQISVLDAEIVKSKRFNRVRSVAAHVIIDVKDKAKARDPENWPEGVKICPWRQKRQSEDMHSKYGSDWCDES